MTLFQLMEFLPYEEATGNLQVSVGGLCTDSRKVQSGDLFICYCGVKVDSHRYAVKAVEQGAVAVVCEKPIENLPEGIACVRVKDGREAVAVLARAFYGFADRKLKLIAVTGTNGKTTTTYMLDAIFRAAKKKTAVVGTLGIRYGEKLIAPELTTPDPIFLHRLFADMVADGIEYVFIEVSAHALWFGKVKGITFEVGIFTNCTQDHLDFFEDMQKYADCKKSLFLSDQCKMAVVNIDDEVGLSITRERKGCLSFGLKNPADVFAVNIEEAIDGTNFVLNAFDGLYDVKLQLPALHNVYNAMGAAACACLLGVDLSCVAEGLNSLKNVSGRLERVGTYHGAQIFVDFAHTPDGLQKSLMALKKLCKGRLVCLFGCGGNRDRLKRPIMGAIAAKIADFCVVTSDNPRYEDPYDIIAEIEVGMKGYGNRYVGITQRDVAIAYAVRLLEKDDILLVAGKGGETYQEIMGIKHEYNDNMVIEKLIG